MLELVLKDRTMTFKITVKAAVALALAVLSVALPQITHAIGGQRAGTVFMPMYMPALLAGLTLDWKWGLAVGLLSPIANYGFSCLVSGSAMPPLERLPYMTLEIATYGLVSGLFSNQVQKTPMLAFPVVLGAQFAGRGVYLISSLFVSVLSGSGPVSATLLNTLAAVETGMPGLYLQAIIVPVSAFIIYMVYKYEQKNSQG